MIYRTALIEKIRKISKRQNIFLTAPGGYGKTVAALQWLASANNTAALTAVSTDNEQGVFYRRLAAALMRRIGKTMPDTGYTLDVLLDTFAQMPQRHPLFHLLIDDLHMIKNEDIQESLPVIITRLPRYVRLCLISRSAPSAALLETGSFGVLTQDDLLFSPEEVEWLGAEKERELTPEQIHDLLETTGGWAMYLSALLSGEASYKRPRTLTQYLETKVWGLWDSRLQALLLRLAIPVELTPALCERLTGQSGGEAVLKRLEKTENAFLSNIGGDTYRFHDIFRDFLLERAAFLDQDELRRLNSVAGEWYYERSEYNTAMPYYAKNRDHEGINRCITAYNYYSADTTQMAVEFRPSVTQQFVKELPPGFIEESPYLLYVCAVSAYINGDAETFLRHLDILQQKLPEITAQYPDILQSAAFLFGLDFRKPMREYTRHLLKTLPPAAHRTETKARVSSITQNLPFFHRSMHDFSEYHELGKEDFDVLASTFGAMTGRDYAVIKHSLTAGIYYERGELLDAAHHAFTGYHACKDDMHPETIFSSSIILSAILYAMGDFWDYGSVMARLEDFIKEKARFLFPNFKAVQTEYALRAGDTALAREWLAVYSNPRLPFYQMPRHFTTLRSYIVLGDFTAAIKFGGRLHSLAALYNRPLDQIESRILTAVALWHNGERDSAAKQMEQALHTSMPYGFAQLFIKEGKLVLPILWALSEKKGQASPIVLLIKKIADRIYVGLDADQANEKPPRLSPMRHKMLAYLEKGLSYGEIATETGLARGTVKRHVMLLYKQLGVHSAADAIIKAKMLGVQ